MIGIALALFAAGTFFGVKVLTPAPVKCPDCKCPPSTQVDLQNFDLDKLNNKKGHFTYSPSLNNVTVKIEMKDSALFKQMLRQAK